MSTTGLLLMLAASTGAAQLFARNAAPKLYMGDEPFDEVENKIGRPFNFSDISNLTETDAEYNPNLHYDNDMIFPDMTDRTGLGSHYSHLWVGGVVPVLPAADLTENEKAKLIKAMLNIMEHTCIRFRNRNPGEKNFILFEKTGSGSGCWADIGMYISRNTSVRLGGNQCFSDRLATHEILHALGFKHTHQRPDRDEYIEVHPENASPGYEQYFYKCDYCYNTTLPYECHSIMHYSSTTFAANNARPVIVAKDPTTCKFPDQYRGVYEYYPLTANDMAIINEAYCPENLPPVDPTEAWPKQQCSPDTRDDCADFVSQGMCTPGSRVYDSNGRLVQGIFDCKYTCYCLNYTCKEQYRELSSECPRWKDYCFDSKWVDFMKGYCSGTCMCGCREMLTDNYPDLCPGYKHLCNDPTYGEEVTTECQATCLCGEE